MHDKRLMKQGFRSDGISRKKSTANIKAGVWRRKGYNARVVPYKKDWEVYKRKRK